MGLCCQNKQLSDYVLSEIDDLFFNSNKHALYSSPWQPVYFGVLLLR